MDLAFYEDVVVGESLRFGDRLVTKEDILDFAAKYDPQPFHLDEVAAKASMLGGLAASGWHTAAMTMRMSFEGFVKNAASMGAPGIEELKWRAPVRPGDRLSARRLVLDKRVSKSRPEMGIVQNLVEVFNQTGEVVMTQKNAVFIGRKGASAPPRERTRGMADPEALSLMPGARFSPGRYLEDLRIGETIEIGAQDFARDDIVAFAKAYDPQPFHVDEEAAKRSHFGGLVASGWQTAALWMKTWIAHRDLGLAESVARSETRPEIGPSPGFRDLKWPHPVYAGDKVRYTTSCTAKRATSRPGWGLAFFDNRGFNQDHVCVLAFTGILFWRMRP